MTPHHTVQNLTFDQENMILAVDGSTYQIPINQASKRLAKATEAERKLYQISPPAMVFTGLPLMKTYLLMG